MYIKQISVFLENKVGRLVEITDTIAKAGIDIRAVSLADTSDYGILRVIVDNPDQAEQVLRDAGYTVAITNVLAVGIQDKPGTFTKVLASLSNNGVNVDYMYAFTGTHNGTAYVIMKMDNLEKGIQVLQNNNAVVLSTDEIYHL